MRNTSSANVNSTSDAQQFEQEAEALITLINKLVNQIEDRLKGKLYKHIFLRSFAIIKFIFMI